VDCTIFVPCRYQKTREVKETLAQDGLRRRCRDDSYLLHARQHLDDERVPRPLGEVALVVVGKRLDDAAQHLVLQERRHVVLRFVVRLEHLFAELQRGHPRGGFLHLMHLLLLVVHHHLPVVGMVAELLERCPLCWVEDAGAKVEGLGFI